MGEERQVPPGSGLSMLTIKALDRAAHLAFSEWTQKWYVVADIEVSDGCVIGGIAEHHDTPDQAVLAFLGRLQQVDLSDFDHVLVTNSLRGNRRHWRWNGAAFVEDRTWQPTQHSGDREAGDD
jgi:hypothetical protein